MLSSSVYAVTPRHLEQRYDGILAACRCQGIGRIALTGAVTGKLFGTLADLRRARERLEHDGLEVFVLVYGLGHPFMAQYYDAQGRPPAEPLFHDGPLVIDDWRTNLLPRGWRYAVNEFGNPVYCNACPDAACLAGNQATMRSLATVFDEIWYDDDYRLDGDQWAGVPHASSAACYCDGCLADLAARLGRAVSREEIIADQALHDAWIEQKTDKLAALWGGICTAARETNPAARMGLMIRWGGEERDGLDAGKLLRATGGPLRFRLGEGHFGADEYAKPVSQAIEHLVASYHVSWFPRSERVLSETTYFTGMPQASIVKKAVLALAAGAEEISYCPCVKDWVEQQNFLAADRPLLEKCTALLADKAALFQPVAILRSAAAGRGDCSPVKRKRDRQPFPWFALAGICSTVVRCGGWRDTADWKVVAVTGRTVWDVSPDQLQGREIVLDGSALLENSPWNRWLGIRDVRQETGGELQFSGGDFRADGRLWTRPGITLVPCVWQDVPEALVPELLRDLRRVLAPRLDAVVVDGDLDVLPVHWRLPEHDVILLVNLAHEARAVRLQLRSSRRQLRDVAGGPVAREVRLAADEVRLLLAT